MFDFIKRRFKVMRKQIFKDEPLDEEQQQQTEEEVKPVKRADVSRNSSAPAEASVPAGKRKRKPKAKRIYSTISGEPIKAAAKEPGIKTMLAHKRAGKGKPAEHRLAYRDKDGKLKASINGKPAEPVNYDMRASALAREGERPRSSRALRFMPSSPRITPKMPRLR